MSHLRRYDPKLEEREEKSQEKPRAPFADVAARFANWITGMDHEHEPAPAPAHARELGSSDESDADPLASLSPGPAEARESSRFPVAPLGYNRTAVDEHLADLEGELSELGSELASLRAQQDAPMSVSEELERIGEQTASILVVAHDKAHETTRRAQEQAERCIADAAANAVAITEEAKQRLRTLDNETDAVWRERERLLEDVRAVSTALASLADQASDRFPAAAEQSATAAFPAAMRAPWSNAGPADAHETRSFTAVEEAEARGEVDAAPEAAQRAVDPGKTANWLAGFDAPAPDDRTQS